MQRDRETVILLYSSGALYAAQHSTAQHSTAQHSTAQHRSKRHKHSLVSTDHRTLPTFPDRMGPPNGTTILSCTPGLGCEGCKATAAACGPMNSALSYPCPSPRQGDLQAPSAITIPMPGILRQRFKSPLLFLPQFLLPNPVALQRARTHLARRHPGVHTSLQSASPALPPHWPCSCCCVWGLGGWAGPAAAAAGAAERVP